MANECPEAEKHLEEIKEAFRNLDRDGNGTISADELRILLQSKGLNPTQDEMVRLMEEIDTNKNGVIEGEEFIAYVKKIYKTSDQQQNELLEAFKVFDKNKDGYISPDELMRVMVNIGERLTPEEAQKLIADADTDGDGKVNYKEFVRIMCPSRDKH